MRRSYVVVFVGCILGAATPAAAGPDKDVVVTVQDPRIIESSGLIARDGDFLTVNDSGDSGRVFVVDGQTGQTIGVTSWSDSASDVEAIAPAGGNRIWVGDIGDNLQDRPWIEVTRLGVREGDRDYAGQTFRLGYPDGARDAEALLVHPVTGRVFVASKLFLAEGQLYEAPQALDRDRVNKLKSIGKVGSFITDGAFFPDGRHLILRGYRRATIYSFPKLKVVGSIRLPAERQGEGIAVSAAGRIFISSEGTNQPVLRVEVPASLRKHLRPPPPPSRTTGPTPASPSQSPSDARDPGDAGDPGAPAGARALPLVAGVAGVGLMIGTGWYLRRWSQM